jgi:hypothetical protein
MRTNFWQLLAVMRTPLVHSRVMHNFGVDNRSRIEAPTTIDPRNLAVSESILKLAGQAGPCVSRCPREVCSVPLGE